MSIGVYGIDYSYFLKKCDLYSYDSNLDLIDKIYVINLDRRFEKWERVNKMLLDYGIVTSRFSGIEGQLLQEKDLKNLTGNFPKRMRLGQLGCFLSHLSVIQDAYNNNLNIIWIMEDDIDIVKDPNLVPFLIKELIQIDDDWDVFYTDIDSKNGQGDRVVSLSSDFRPDTVYLPLEYYTNRYEVSHNIQHIGQRFGNYSYVVSRKGIPLCSGSLKISGSSVPARITPSMSFFAFIRSTMASKPARVSGKNFPGTNSLKYLS